MNFRFGTWGAAASVLLISSTAIAEQAAPAAPLTAEVLPLVSSRSLMLDVTDAASRGIIVGERGHILVSESRSDWRQVEGVPTRATLTAVTAVGDKVWAVGHDGIILHSGDGGQSWAVQRLDPKDPPSDDPMAEYNPQDGAPLLDVVFEDASRGYAVGAFSLMLRTDDGGASWTAVDVTPAPAAIDPAAAAEVDPAMEEAGDEWTFSEDDLALDEEDDPHLNGLVRTGSGLLLVVGERGSAFRSRDAGVTWERLQLPYAGSMFGVLALGDEHLVAYGLRGHVLETRDGGTSWTELDTSTELSLMGGAALPEGGFVVVGANGVVLRRENATAPVAKGTYVNQNNENPVLASVMPLGTRTFLVCGDKGLGRYEATN